MPRLSVNMQEAVSFEPVPDANYECEITEFQAVKKAGTGTTYVPVVLTIRDDGEYEGRKLFMNLMLGGKGAGITKDFLSKAGVEYEDSSDGGLEFDTDDAIGQRVGVVTKQREFPEGSGQFSSEVKKILSV
jgi:hypothetical protein